MITQTFNKSLNLDILYKDILGKTLLNYLHHNCNIEDWNDNKRYVYYKPELASFEPFDKLDFLSNFSCSLKIKQYISKDSDNTIILKNIIKVKDLTVIPKIKIYYTIKFSKDIVQCFITYKSNKHDFIINAFNETILKIALENMILYHKNVIESVYQ